MAKVKAVIFDMDGTLLDTLASIAGFGNAALKAHGYPEIETERYRQLVGNGADVLMRRMLETAKAGQLYSEDEVQALRATYDALYESDPTRLVAPYPGIPALLRAVREAGVKTAVLVSGGGTNLQAILDKAASGGMPSVDIDVVVSDREGAFALERAEKARVDTAVIPYKALGGAEFERRLNALLEDRKIGLIVLAGFMRILSADFTSRYPERILNIHPSLIPSFCGEGYYGLRVHEAALGYGVKVTGATVHFVNEVPDGGRIIMQKAVYIDENDTPETLQQRVMREAEWVIYPEAIEKVASTIRRQ